MTDRISWHDIQEMKRKVILANSLLRPPRAAELLKISVRTLYRLDEEGLIRSQPLRPGQIKGRRYSLQSIEEYRQRVLGEDYLPLDPSTISGE